MDGKDHSVAAIETTGANGSASGPIAHPLDRTPGQYVPDKGPAATVSGLEGCEDVGGFDNEGSLAKRFM